MGKIEPMSVGELAYTILTDFELYVDLSSIDKKMNREESLPQQKYQLFRSYKDGLVEEIYMSQVIKEENKNTLEGMAFVGGPIKFGSIGITAEEYILRVLATPDYIFIKALKKVKENPTFAELVSRYEREVFGTLHYKYGH